MRRFAWLILVMAVCGGGAVTGGRDVRDASPEPMDTYLPEAAAKTAEAVERDQAAGEAPEVPAPDQAFEAVSETTVDTAPPCKDGDPCDNGDPC